MQATDLLPELQDRNGGEGMSPSEWLRAEWRSDFAVAFADFFWPTFVEFEGYVLRAGFAIDELRSLEGKSLHRRDIEARMNTLSLTDMVIAPEDQWTDLTMQRALYIGAIVSETYQAKLKRDFPNRVFFVQYRGEEDFLKEDEIYLTFWRVSA